MSADLPADLPAEPSTAPPLPGGLPDGLRHWKLALDDEAIAWLDADRADASSNTLGEAVIEELDAVLDWAERAPLAGLVIGSAKPGSFILGADIREFDRYTEASAVSQRIREGHRVFARLEALSCPTAATVHGFCLGGGLELALCCDWLLALDVPATRLGLPEVKLGIFPGLGGTVRITERLGGPKGLELALSARMLRAGAAKRAGLVDELVGEFASLHWAARRAVLRKRRWRGGGRLAGMTNAGVARQALARIMTKKTAEKANPAHYPAPFEMIDLWVEHRGDRQRMFDGEAERVGRLMVSPTARNLRRLYFLTERLKALGNGDASPPRRVHVIGAGVMGGDIAAWCALKGLEVTLQDRARELIEPALQRARKLFARRLKGGTAVRTAMTRLIADPHGRGVARADVVIEAISENPEAKRALYAALEPRLAPGAVLATNTSALPLADLSRDLAEPSRLIGLHFFNPVARMPLVEVVHDEGTDPARVASGCAFVGAIDRFPLPVRSAPGFLVNRVLAPYLLQAFTLLTEGIERDTIDAAAIRWGMPMGPIELADTVGLDVCRHVAATLTDGDVAAEAALLDERIEAGHLGKKSGRGFYVWKKGRADRTPHNLDDPTAERLAGCLLQPFLDACVSASADRIVADDDLLDAGIVFGTGFAPFRGGPLHWLAGRGEHDMRRPDAGRTDDAVDIVDADTPRHATGDA